ncbi:MAG: hypothetical protein IJ809_03440 [Clostridia bacterium]|nr:hypothetical protein [Clostridia bacterium]
MREMVFGYYRNEVYIIEDEEGNVLYNLTDGTKFDVAGLNYYVGKNKQGMFVAREGVSPQSKGIFVLEDNKCYLMATTMLTAKNQLFKEYKPLKSGDVLFETLKKYQFIPQCMRTKYELGEIEIPASYKSWCHNYTNEKKWYRYVCYTDSTDFSDILVSNQACITCPKRSSCPESIKRTYRGLYNGTYVFVVKENVKTGKKLLQEIEITEDADRAFIASVIDSIMEN